MVENSSLFGMLAYLGFGFSEDPALTQVMLQSCPELLKEGDREWLKNL